jgi:iron complex outermembrane receptor protein
MISNLRSGLTGGASFAALSLGLAIAGGAAAQTAAATQPAEPSATALEEVVVTGTRLQTSGFQAPTPVTVSTADQLRAQAPGNLADGLNQLPVFNGSTKTYQATGGGLAAGTAGQNILNLRSLGGNRALVLLDGRRMVGTNETGSVDINMLPQNLVQRVDVVTGGASAAYGSDAVAGVVNFVLDTKFQGLKFEIQGGESTYGDSKSFLTSIAVGHQFLDGRLRVIASSEFSRQGGIGAGEHSGRGWYDNAAGQIPNPAGGSPAVLVVPHLVSAIGSYGGLISSGPLKGTQFGVGGASTPFLYGPIVGSVFMSGGDPLAGNPANSLSPNQNRQTNFAYAEFDVTDNLTAFVDGLYGRSHVQNDGSLNFGTGAAAQLNIFRDNAYLPADILARMVTANVQSIPLGRYYTEFGPVRNESLVYVHRISAGLKGKILGNWAWDASVSRGESRQKLAKNNVPNLRNYFAASDAVRNAAGQIVCRSTLSGFDPGCVPMNPFGVGSVSQAAADYIMGDSFKELSLKQTVAMANLSGDLGDKLQFGAGPIAVAVGGEYRKEEAKQTADAVSQQIVSLNGLRTGVAPTSINNRLGPFQFYNPQPYQGSYNIKEYYGEVGVPLLKDLPFVQMLDLSLAARHATYSQSGGVTTWKYGANWQVNNDLRFRATRSRDIRGPGALELFNTQTQTNQTIVYKGQTTQNVNLTSGNPDLKPERALTETYGVVYRPSYFPGFQVSLDRYTIDITDAIGNLSAQQTADQCTAGNAEACGQIDVQSNGTLIIHLRPLNLSTEKNAGYDFESAYSTSVLGGGLTLRALVNHTTDAYRIVPGTGKVQSLGSPGQPKWRGTLSAQYTRDQWSVFLTENVIGKAKIDPTKVEGVDTNDNSLPALVYTNLTARYKFDAWSVKGMEAFASITNLFNQDPPVSGGNPTSYNTPAAFAYDTMGRYFTVGLRVNLR